MHYKIGTRGSKLALAQSEYVRKRLEESFPEDTFELVIISTTGDKITDRPLAAIGSKGLFVTVAPTAARAETPKKRPTMIVSTRLYTC